MRITVTCRVPDEYADPDDGTGLTEAGLYALVGALDERGFDDVQLIGHDGRSAAGDGQRR